LLRKAKDEYIRAEKERIVNDYKQRLVQDEIKLKIEKSASENRVRIERMQDINQKIIALERICAQAIVNDQAKDQQKYKHFLRDLIIQVNPF
jgi:16S rRNA C1402 (ribose-2'-O) methylase RsmI